MTERWKSYFAKKRSGKRPKQFSAINRHMGLKKQIMDHTNCGTKIEPHEGVKRNDRCDNKQNRK